MLAKTKSALDGFYARKPQLGLDHKLHPLDERTMIAFSQGEKLAEIHRQIRPDLSVEIGLAYGFSTIFLLDSMFENRYGRHIAIDPFQKSYWHGIGAAAVEQLGFADRFTWLDERSDAALSRMNAQGCKTQYVYIDGNHTFDAALIDFCCSDQILDIGGVIIIDDMWMPAIQKVVSFIAHNMAHYQRVEIKYDNICCVKKLANDNRSWDHFAPF
jgi:predicted O-methyltransferase YrrM